MTITGGVPSQSNYFEQIVPLDLNSLQTISTSKGSKNFIASNTRGASGLISTIDNKVEKVMLIIVGFVENIYAGINELDCSTATDNQWQVNLDGGSWSDLTPDGQMNDGDWECGGQYTTHNFTYIFNVTDQITNIDGKIGLRLQNAISDQDSLQVWISVFLKILYKL